MRKTKLLSFLLAFSILLSSIPVFDSKTEISSDFKKRAQIALFKAASKLTDPACKSHEYFRRIYIEEALNPTPLKITSVGRACLLFVQLVENVRRAVVTTLPGIVLRSFAMNLQTQPFIDLRSENQPVKLLPESRTFTLLSWNVCCVGAGFPISDGGVLPWSERIDRIIDKVIEKDADVNCLYETFDTTSAFQIYEKLKNRGYSHFYFNIGPKAFGVSSGIFVASKYAITNAEFVPFAQESLVGRTKNVEKGVFAFDLQSEGENFARIFTTHLQHSEQPEFSTDEEKSAREEQMRTIIGEIQRENDKCLVVTGDLNLDDAEYASSSWNALFEKQDHFESLKTWGGDGYCAALMGKPASGPLNLDHTMVVKGTARSLHTSLVDVSFDGTSFKKEALSDHLGLYSEIGV